MEASSDAAPQQRLFRPRPRPPPQSRKCGTHQPGVDAVYHQCDGLRHVSPYHFEHLVHAKQRWFGRALVTVLTSEFKHAEGAAYYARAIASGRVTINGKRASAEQMVQPGDLVSHRQHRHEPPVLDGVIPVLHSDGCLVVIDKPASLAVHPCGKYWHNTVVGVLRAAGEGLLHPVHRLDRWTSGVLILARDAQTAASYGKQIQQHQLSKTYLARVVGKFPADGRTVDAPIGVVVRSRGLHGVTESGKLSRTEFRCVSFNGHTSVVECRPVTGRTHQIRIHLQHAGFPIANDPVYGGKVFVDNTYSCTSMPAHHQQQQSIEDDCSQCASNSYYDGRPHCTHIWLHAWRYSGPAFSFTAPPPAWAEEHFDSRALKEVSETGIENEERDAESDAEVDGEASGTTEAAELPAVALG